MPSFINISILRLFIAVIVVLLIAGGMYRFPQIMFGLADMKTIIISLVGMFLGGPAWYGFGRLSTFDKLEGLPSTKRDQIKLFCTNIRKSLIREFLATGAIIIAILSSLLIIAPYSSQHSASLVPASSVPASSVPASSVPASSVPASSVPASSVPASSVPASSVPASSVPASSVPASSVPASSVPASSVPELITSSTSLPDGLRATVAIILGVAFYFMARSLFHIVGVLFQIESNRETVAEWQLQSGSRQKLIDQLRKMQKEEPLNPDEHLSKFKNQVD